MNSIVPLKTACLLFLVCVAVIAAPAQTLTILANFDGTNGDQPLTALTQGLDGNFYGTTNLGSGASERGTIFKVTPEGTLTTIYNFCSLPGCLDGDQPHSQLVLGTDGNFYGMTAAGGTQNRGIVFKVLPTGELTVLHNFCALGNPCLDGFDPSWLLQADDGNFYGTTVVGGDPTTICVPDQFGCGTIFKLTPAGQFTTIFTFCAPACSEGPLSLTQGTDGKLYGTTGGLTGSAVFTFAPPNNFTVINQFPESLTEGFLPSPLVEGTDGNFYAVSLTGGAFEQGAFLKITPGGKVTTLRSFSCSTGFCLPQVALVQGTDGNFYGNSGGFFKANAEGEVSPISVSAISSNSLIQGTDGSFYGTSQGSGATDCAQNCGTAFRLSVGLAPFVSFLHSRGKTGQTAQILGQGFTGATGVSFNGTLAAFTVVSDTYLKATVPVGAITGPVTVTEPSGSLQSNVPFRVTPQISGFSPASGTAGSSVVITGQSFTGATVVTFDCKWQASFTVNSDTQITATVPPNATIGTITVRTAGGAIESVDKFTVIP